MAQVKGSMLVARLQYVRERHGAAAQERLLASLPAPDEAFLRGSLLPHGWAPYETFVSMSVAIDQMFGRGDMALCYELGRHAAGVNLPTLYKIFYRLGTPLFVFRKAARLWEVHYDSGRLIPIQEGPTTVRLRICDFADPHEAHCLSVKGWAARSVELSGATLVALDEDRCRRRGDAACEFVLGWR